MLWSNYDFIQKRKKTSVLILVLVDYALEQILHLMIYQVDFGFNPCFSGLCFGAINSITYAIFYIMF